MATTIDLGNEFLTWVDVFTVHVQDQPKLLEVLDTAVEQVMRHLPGFVSANLHTSLEGTRVLNYVQWRNVDDFKAMLCDPALRKCMAEAEAIATTFDPHLYRVSETFHV